MARQVLFSIARPVNMSERRQWRLTSPQSTELAPPLERASQAVVMDWCWAEGHTRPALRFVFAVPNGEKRDKKTAALLQRQGVKPGVPDLIAPFARCGFIGLAVEMKRPPNRPTDVQQTWLDTLASFGWKAVACYSATEAIKVIDEYESGPMTEY